MIFHTILHINGTLKVWAQTQLSMDSSFIITGPDVAKRMISVFNRVENTVGKGENAGYQHFLLFPQCFQKVPFLG